MDGDVRNFLEKGGNVFYEKLRKIIVENYHENSFTVARSTRTTMPSAPICITMFSRENKAP